MTFAIGHMPALNHVSLKTASLGRNLNECVSIASMAYDTKANKGDLV